MSEHVSDAVLLDIIGLISNSPQISQRQVASSLGMSLGKVKNCLRAFIAKGFIKAENCRNSTNRLAYLYVLTPEGVTAKAEFARYFLARKMDKFELLRLEIDDSAS